MPELAPQYPSPDEFSRCYETVTPGTDFFLSVQESGSGKRSEPVLADEVNNDAIRGDVIWRGILARSTAFFSRFSLYFLAHWLCLLLGLSQLPTHDEVVRHLTLGVAANPKSAGAWFNLGSELTQLPGRRGGGVDDALGRGGGAIEQGSEKMK